MSSDSSPAPPPPPASRRPGVDPTRRASAMWTVAELLEWTAGRFAEVGIESARGDAAHLLAHAIGCPRIGLYVRHDEVVPEPVKAVFRESVRRRIAHEPVAYIEGRRGFHALDLELYVDPRVLVPRPETEHLVDWLLEELRAPPSPPMAVLDVGTGSGAIALAIKHARPDVVVAGADVSREALEVARHNAEVHRQDVALVHSDLLEQVNVADLPIPVRGFTAIAANLPYVARAELDRLSRDVQFEPRLALDGGDDGLVLVRRLIASVVARSALTPGGGLYLEVGYDQAAVVSGLLGEAGFTEVATRLDYAGIPRIVRGFAPRIPSGNGSSKI